MEIVVQDQYLVPKWWLLNMTKLFMQISLTYIRSRTNQLRKMSIELFLALLDILEYQIQISDS
jgi:hypothetical protein